MTSEEDGRAPFPAMSEDKLLTDEEWASLSAESRHKLNVFVQEVDQAYYRGESDERDYQARKTAGQQEQPREFQYAGTEIKRWFCQRCQREHSIAMPISGCEPPENKTDAPKN